MLVAGAFRNQLPRSSFYGHLMLERRGSARIQGFGSQPAEVAPATDFAVAGNGMLEQGLDLGTVGGDAVLLVAGRGMNQQVHGPLKLRCPVSLLLLGQPDLGVVHRL